MFYNGSKNSGMTITGINNNFLIGFKSHSTRCNPYLAPLLVQEPMAKQVIDLRGDPTTITLSNMHNINTDSLWLIIIPIDHYISHSSTEIFLFAVVINTGTHNCTSGRE